MSNRGRGTMNRNVRSLRSNTQGRSSNAYANNQPSHSNNRVRVNDDGEDDNLSNVIKTFKTQLNVQFEQMEQLTSSYQFMSDTFDKFQEEITRLSKDGKIMKKQIERLQSNEKELVKRIQFLENATARTRQLDNSNHMIITNAPKIDSAIDLKDFVVQIGNQVQQPIDKSDIIEVYQNENKRFNSYPIIVKMKTPELKIKCMEFRKAKNTIDIKAIIPNAPDDQAKINFHQLIEKEFSDILKKAKEIGRSKNYKYIWFKDSAVFARKEDNSRVIKIHNESELNKIV